MLSRLLVPLDGSPIASRSLPYAVALARALRGEILLVHVVPDPPAGQAAARVTDVDLDRLAAELRAGGITARPCVVAAAHRGVAHAILEVAREQLAGLIVMSTHGRSGVGRWLYGSVAEELVGAGEVPVVLVSAVCARSWPAERPRALLVPLDGSALAEAALPLAGHLAATLQADLHLLRVVEPVDEARYRGWAPRITDPAAELGEAWRYLEAIASPLRRARGMVEVHVRLGPAPSTIALLAEELGVDLIVMATHGRGGLPRLVLGSVATATLQRASMPILVVRPGALPRAVRATPRAAQDLLLPGEAVTVNLTPAELSLLEEMLAGREAAGPEEAARDLLAKLREAKAVSAALRQEHAGPRQREGDADLP